MSKGYILNFIHANLFWFFVVVFFLPKPGLFLVISFFYIFDFVLTFSALKIEIPPAIKFSEVFYPSFLAAYQIQGQLQTKRPAFLRNCLLNLQYHYFEAEIVKIPLVDFFPQKCTDISPLKKNFESSFSTSDFSLHKICEGNIFFF